MPNARITNALTIDVEDYFQVSAFAPYIARADWDSRECRVERNIDRILALLEEHDTEATFFTLGWIAERYPQLVRRIASQGHEVASHGYGHERASDLDEVAFSADIRRAKGVLEDLTGSEAKERFFNTGVEAVGSTPEEFANKIKSDVARMGKLIRDAGIGK